MLIRKTIFTALSISLAAVSWAARTHAQDATPPTKAATTPAGQSGEAEMMAKMMELGKPSEYHRQLTQLDGNWDYTVKFSMTPGQPLGDAGRGTAVRTAVMDGRYFITKVTGKMLMPAADGKMKDTEFEGMSLDGYDNVKQKFFSTWIDNMGTSIALAEGSYDPASKSFTYLFEMEVMPGVKTKTRQVVKIIDKDHHDMEWYETQGGQEVKTMEIDYVRKE